MKHLSHYSTLFLIALALCCDVAASAEILAAETAPGARVSSAYSLLTPAVRGTALYNGTWYPEHQLAQLLASSQTMFATCGGVVGGTAPADDFDGDGVCNGIDLDDDNDGILDAAESPGCFYSINEWSRDVTYVTSDLAFLPNGPLSEAIDGIEDNSNFFAMMSGCSNCLLDKALIQYQPPLSSPITINDIELVIGINNAFPQSSFVMEGYNGTAWEALSAAQAMTTPNITYTFTNTLHPDALYYQFRIKGNNATGDVTSGTRIHEVYFRSDKYTRSLQYKPACTAADLDGDGLANHFDLDSDGDGCSDAREAGVVGEAGAGNMSDATGTNPGGPVSLSQATVNAPYGENGLATVLQSATDSNAYKGSYSTLATYASLINSCTDFDNDGIADASDTDDDNDGIPDCSEGYAAMPFGTPVTNLNDGPGGPNGTDPKTASFVTAEDGTVLMDATVTVAFGVSFFLPSNAVAPISGQNNVLQKDIQTNGTGWVNYNLVTQKTGAYGFILKNRGNPPTTNHTTEWPDLHVEYNSDYWQATLVSFKTVAGVDATPPAGLTIGGVVESGKQYPGIANRVFEVKLTPLRTIQSGTSVDIRLWHLNPANVESPTLALVFDNCLDRDTDGDGIANRIDLDSDGDGCSDAMESGVGGTLQQGNMVNQGGTVSSNNAIAAGPYGSNGLADGVETTAESGQINYTSTYFQYALDGTIKLCEDYDGDGFSDYVDLDDDNDGILDAVESPTCFYTSAEANAISAVTTIHTSPDDDQGDGDIQILHDGDLTGAFNFSTSYTVSAGMEIFTVKYPVPLKLASLIVSQRISSTANSIGKLFGSNNGIDYTEVPTTAPVNINTASNVTFSPTGAAPAYRFYQIRAAGITSNSASTIDLVTTTIGEITSSVAAGYIPSAHPKANCTADTDGDGIPNHHDLDSDGDGCPDAIEGTGGFTTADLKESTLPGGNSGGTYTGQVTFGVDDNLGNDVDGNGVPSAANGGQPVGTSQTAGTPCPEIEPCTLTIGGTVRRDIDGLTNGVSGSGVNGTINNLYVSLVQGSTVQKVAPVAADGTYQLTGVASPATYQLVLSTSPAGSTAPSFPAGSTVVGEGGEYNETTGFVAGDGTPDGTTEINLTCPAAVSQMHFDFGVDNPMPVTLVNFHAKQATEGTLLEWNTTEETNFDRFEIEQSVSPKAAFNRIGTVKGGMSKYNYLDAVTRIGASYYRLKMIDTDGTYSYSSIVFINKLNGVNLYRVYPNPSNGRQVFVSSASAIDSYEIFDAAGRKVAARLIRSGDQFEFRFGKEVQPGVYVITYKTGGRAISQQFVVSY